MIVDELIAETQNRDQAGQPQPQCVYLPIDQWCELMVGLQSPPQAKIFTQVTFCGVTYRLAAGAEA